jgi:uncharacterized protein (TIGR02145 family)
MRIVLMTLIFIHLITHKSKCQNSEIGNNIPQSMPINITLANSPDEGILSYGGQDYTTKIMPDGRRWMTQNLNIGVIIKGKDNMSNNGIIEKFCYDNDIANCVLFGGLYKWDEMMQYTTEENAQGICPAGWHIPTDAEWDTLENSLSDHDKASRLAGNALYWADGKLDQSIFFGESGFEAMPSGNRYDDGWFLFKGESAVFWSSTQSGISDARYRGLAHYNSDNVVRFGFSKAYSFSVRCMQD